MRRSLSFLAKLSFSLLLLGAVLARIDYHKLPAYFADVSPGMLLLTLLLAMLQVPATSLRWHLLLITVGVRLPVRTTLEVNIVSIFANSVLVNVVGGIVTRVAFLLDHDVSAHNILSTTLLERIVIAIVLGGMTFAGLWMSGIYPHVDARLLVRMSGFGLFGLMAITVIAYLMSKQFRTAIDKASAVLLHTCSDLRALIVDWKGLAVAFVLTLISQMMLVGVGVLVGYIMHVTVPLWQMAMILPGVALISSLPIGLGGVGLREISMVTILGVLGVSTEQSLVLSITIGAITLGGSALAYGLVLLTRIVEQR